MCYKQHIYSLEFFVKIIAASSLLVSIACGGSSTSKSNGLSGANVEPLSKDTFVFLRLADNTYHLYAYDTATRKERLITKFEDLTKPSSLAISPDRKWIAFTGNFRMTDTDLNTGYATGSVGVVSADGAQLQRISEPMTASLGTKCTGDTDCEAISSGPQYCRGIPGYQKYCMEDLEERNLSISSWSPDGQNILMSYTMSYWDHEYDGEYHTSRQYSSTTFGSVPFAGGMIDIYVDAIKDLNYSIGGYYSVSPSGDSLLANLDVDYDSTRGLYIVQGVPPDLGTAEEIVKVEESSDLAAWPFIIQTAWSPDGKSALFLVSMTTDLNDERVFSTDIKKKCDIKGMDCSCKEEANIDGKTIDRFGVSSDGTKLVLGLNTGGDNPAIDIYIKDRNTGKLEPITNDGISFYPVW